MQDHTKRITEVIVFIMAITFVSGQLCRSCAGLCNKGGVCSGNCVLGWDGPTCSRRNVAFNQTTKQSSDWRDPHTGQVYVSSFAADGKHGHVLYDTPCTRTDVNRQPAHWTVTMDAQYHIYRFRIYNRNDLCGALSCGRRLKGFSLSVGNSSENYKLCYQDSTTSPSGPGALINGVCNGGPVFGDTVRIMIDNSETLSLCEVEIFVCTPGMYGEDCGNRCGHCAEGPSVCNTISGNCPQRTPRCMAGYTGVNCNIVCTAGIYGADCLKRCGHCADNQLPCDGTSGDCTDTSPRCKPGFSGPRCDTACRGTYGPDCGKRCGHCAGLLTACDVTSGNCTKTTPRCMPGYTGVKCDTECTRGTYGPDCEENCSFCAEGSAACNSTSGHCPDRKQRCALGYSGLKCDTVSSLNSPDYTGVIIGCSVGISLILIIGIIVIVLMMRRFRRNAQTGGATTSSPNSTSTQESSFSSDALATSEVAGPSSQDKSLGRNSCDDNPYEVIRHNTSAL